MNIYRCPVCGYLQIGEIDFHFCPICKTPAELFRGDPTAQNFAHWDAKTRIMIEHMADTGHYYLEGKGTTRKFLNMDDLLFMPGQISAPPLLDDEPVATEIILGKVSSHPITVKTPILNAGMSFGALSREAKMALAKASRMVGGIANSGEGGMLDEERELADRYTLQYASGRFGASEDRLKMADMIEIKISQGAKPSMGGKLPGSKVTEEISQIRELPPHRMAESPSRHKDINTPQDLSNKIAWLREITDHKPISLKFVGGHIEEDLDAVFSQENIPDVIVIDGGEGGTGAAPVFTKDHIGLPLVYALPRVVEYIDKNGLREKITLIATGGFRHSADVAKALALGAEAVYMAGALKIAMGCKYIRECHLGTCPYGIATQTKVLRKRLDVDRAAQKIAKFINAATEELRTFARICGKNDIHKLDRKDLRAINPELARVTGVEMANGGE
ncbi:MAG: nitronate monooxygenase [Candidatus Aminicenantes bacterium]|nr:MAG: nitronate monooxygenase [Candidatus Aminicenantes bacterium]